MNKTILTNHDKLYKMTYHYNSINKILKIKKILMILLFKDKKNKKYKINKKIHKECMIKLIKIMIKI